MSTAESNSTLPITRRSISYTENVHVATENDDPSEEVGIEGTFERICSSHAENLSSIFNQLGLDFKDQKAMAELRDEIEAAMRYGRLEQCYNNVSTLGFLQIFCSRFKTRISIIVCCSKFRRSRFSDQKQRR